MEVITPEIITTPERGLQSAGSTLNNLADLVVEYDAGVKRSFVHQWAYAYLCGNTLNQAKSLLPHGQFGDWVKTCQISNGSAHRYMDFAERFQAKFPTVGNLDSIASANSM